MGRSPYSLDMFSETPRLTETSLRDSGQAVCWSLPQNCLLPIRVQGTTLHPLRTPASASISPLLLPVAITGCRERSFSVFYQLSFRAKPMHNFQVGVLFLIHGLLSQAMQRGLAQGQVKR